MKEIAVKQKRTLRLLSLQCGVSQSIEKNTIELSKEEFRERYKNKGNGANQIMEALADFVSLKTIGENLIWPQGPEKTKQLLLSLKLIKE